MVDFLSKNRMLVSCPWGITPFLREELISLNMPILAETPAGVLTEGSLVDAMRINLLVRTGQRVLFLLKEFGAINADELYRELSGVRWEEYIDEEGYVCVTSQVDTPGITDSRYANLKCKDAIVDRIKERCGVRPDSGPERDRTVVHLKWLGGWCSVYLDTSGEALSRRGYRKIPLRAPMQEVLAAAVVLATGWKGEGSFINPMCGSGTLAIEAALLALNRAPGLLRNNFGFMHIKGYKQAPWHELRQDAKRAVKQGINVKIIATDVDSHAVDAARRNAMTAGVEHLIDFGVCGYQDTSVPDGGGVVVLNPEYGVRMGELKQLEDTYKEIGDFFKAKCRGYLGYVFTGNLGLAKKVGLRTKRRIQFYNGDIECRLLEYELYEGSRKKRDEAQPT